MKLGKFKNVLIILGLLAIAIPVLLPFLQKGFFVTDDGEWMIIRFSAFYQALADGQFPVRFLHRLNFDYGYPVATFLYPGFLYAGVIFHLFKIGVVDTIKIIFIFSLLGSTIFTYWWLYKIFDKKFPALIGAIVSLYLPYRLYDVFTRGSMGEIFALLWVPFILWMLEKKNLFFVSIGVFLLIISHNTMALLFLPLLFVYALFRKLFAVKMLLISFTLGVLLSSFFFIPILFELPLTRFSQTVISEPLHYFASYQLIGISSIVITLLALVLFSSRNKFLAGQKKIVRLFLIVSILSIFISHSWSSFLWQNLPSSFIQFPFRVLSYLTVSLAFLTAFIVIEMNYLLKKIVVISGLLLLIIFSSFSYLTPKSYFDKGEGYYITNEATTTVLNEYLPTWVREQAQQRAAQKGEIIEGKGEIQEMAYDNKKISFRVTSEDAVKVKINTIYWPGWEAFVDGEKKEITYANDQGVMEISLQPGSHNVKLIFSETPIRLIADFISLVSLAALILLGIKQKYQ